MRIKTGSTSFLSAVLVAGASSQRILQESGTDTGIPEVWGATVPIAGGTSESQFEDGQSDGIDVSANLIEMLETDDQVSVVGSVELGELVCDSLLLAADAPALSFVIQDETLIADQDSYTFTSGDAFDDGIGVHVWTGIVYSPEQADDELVPRTVSISWGEVCDVETFLLKVTKRNSDGTTSMIKTVPCDAVGLFICLVEVLVDFEEPGEVIIPEEAVVDFGNTTITTTPTPSSATTPAPAPTGRRMQEETQVDVMILYSNQALALLGGVTHEQMKTTILESMAWTNQAFVNSQVALRFNPVHIGLLPYDETTTLNGPATLDELRLNADVALLRDEAQADLVQMIGNFNDFYCGWGYYFYNEAYGFSLVKPTCLDNYIHTHEYGHNMGCFHNRDDTAISSDYSHGLRYCDGLLPYRTIMSYSCGSPYANYFSNPDVIYLDRVTGTLQEDNARTIEDNMGAISNYRGGVVPPTPAPSLTEPPTTAPPTTGPPTTGPPTTAPPSTTPIDYTSVGCYVDDAHDRVLTGEFVKGDAAMTTEVCAALCEGYAYFGTEYSDECFCSRSTDEPMRLGETTCSFPCSGDADQICGGRNALSLYEYTTTPTTYPFVGCYGDDKHDRVLSGEAIQNDPTMTTEVCATFCTGSPYFGTEFGNECFCGVESDDPDELGPATCDHECAGDASEICGGRDALSVYTYDDIVVVEPTYLGCWGDSRNGRIMDTVQSDPAMTNDLCDTICAGYPYYGLQYGQECWCGNDTTDYDVYGPSTACDYECAGDAEEFCGGYNAMDVWSH